MVSRGAAEGPARMQSRRPCVPRRRDSQAQKQGQRKGSSACCPSQWPTGPGASCLHRSGLCRAGGARSPGVRTARVLLNYRPDCCQLLWTPCVQRQRVRDVVWAGVVGCGSWRRRGRWCTSLHRSPLGGRRPGAQGCPWAAPPSSASLLPAPLPSPPTGESPTQPWSLGGPKSGRQSGVPEML